MSSPEAAYDPSTRNRFSHAAKAAFEASVFAGALHFNRHLRPHLTPFKLAVAAVVAIVTGGFATLVLLILLVATNFNLLGWME